MQNPPSSLNLSQAQHLAWLHQQPAPETTREALGRLLETARHSMDSLDAGQLVAAQTRLEDVLIQTLIAMKTLDVDPEAALQRALHRLQDSQGDRAFHVFADHVEVRVHGEVRGEWPLYVQSDYEAVLILARDLGCNVIHEEAAQLGLFTPISQKSEAYAGPIESSTHPA
jgi:hypothetical protein